MGYLRKIDGSPYWQAVYMNQSNAEVQRSTKTVDRKEAEIKLHGWAFSAHLLRQENLCKHRTRAVVSEMTRLIAGDKTPLITYQSYSKGYLAMSKSSVEIQTYSNRKSGLKVFSAYLGDDVMLPLEDIVKPHIIGFRDNQAELGRSPETVKQRIELLHAFFEDAVTEKVIKHNPVDGVIVKIPRDKTKGNAKKKRKALNYDEGVKLVDAASVEELVVAVMGLDLAARVGDAFGLLLPQINLETGRIVYWVEKADVWHTVNLFPATLPFLTEYVQYHRPKTDSPLLMPTIGIVAGPEANPRQHRSEGTVACMIIHELVQRAKIGESVELPSGKMFYTVSFHCFRITNNNALKMAGVSTEWVMWRMCQKDKNTNEVYNRFTPDNGKKAIFGKLGIEHEAGEMVMPVDGEKVDDGSMTFAEMMKLIEYARQKLVAIRLGNKQLPPTP